MSVIAIDVEDDGDPRPLKDALIGAIEHSFDIWRQGDQRDPVSARLSYADYLNTDHWRALRERKLLRSGRLCQSRPICIFEAYDSEPRKLDVHHLTYVRLGRELESDLIVLCRYCHANEHGKTAL